ncbi:MAG: carbamate kinase [Deltaproteobacteria bacterium]|nr:carbamate kinase [Deltaproteobacteria bacterium]
MGHSDRPEKKFIVSIGGNTIIRRGDKGTIEEQTGNTRLACGYIARLFSGGKRVIITHGNGPIVGNIIIRNEAAKGIIPPMPIYICGADSEGGMGFMIQQALHNELSIVHSITEAVTIVTQVVVDRNDPAFNDPSKPVGPYYTKEEALTLTAAKGWVIKEDSLRGWRRSVASPRPVRIVEAGVIKRLFEEGVIVIAAGGGGVPVIEREGGALAGVDAVIDKDLATSLLGKVVGAEVFINLTEIDRVYIDFGKASAHGLAKIRVKEAKRYLAQGEFAPGSMGPKVEAAIEFIEAGGKEVIITSPELLGDAIRGRAGTSIVA